MTAKTWHSSSALMTAVLAACLAAGCGGSDSGPETPTPTPTPSPPPSPAPTPTPTPTPQPNTQLKFELLTGTAMADLNHCQSTDGPASEARFSYLERIVVYKDAIYLAETGNGCLKDDFSTPPAQQARQMPPKIRKLSGGKVETALSLFSPEVLERQGAMARFPGGFYRDEKTGAFYVAGYAAARFKYNHMMGKERMDWYDKAGAWNYFVPGIFKYEGNAAGENNLLAGMPGKRPDSFVDGRGKMAQFQAPHDLEADASGLLYVIDGGDDTRIRTISSNGEVKTLDGYRTNIRALDADRQGHIHALAETSSKSFAWHRLSDGSKTDIDLRPSDMTEFTPRPRKVIAFTVLDNEIVLADRWAEHGASVLYRVSSQGAIKKLTGTRTPASLDDFVKHPDQFALPPVQHLKYGVDGNLYIVLEQGVLIVRDFR